MYRLLDSLRRSLWMPLQQLTILVVVREIFIFIVDGVIHRPVRDVGATIVVFCLLTHLKNHSKSCFTAHHQLISFGCFFKRKNLIHRTDTSECAKRQSVLRVNGSSTRPSDDFSASSDEQ